MENIIVSESQAILLDLFTDEELAAKREANKDKPDIIAKIDAHVEGKAIAQAKAQAMNDFTGALQALELPQAPEGVYNVYRAWHKDTRHLYKKEREAILSANPTLTEAELDTRLIELDTYSWGDWTFNKAMTQGKVGTSGTKASARKLAVVVSKHHTDTADELIGNFRTSKEACVHLGLDTKGDSANRVLIAHKYSTDIYEGNDYLVPES